MHAHDHAHGRGRRASRRALAATLALVLGFAVLEAVAGLLADSLALLADAGHMFGDSASLALALFAVWIAERPPTPERSFGFHRAEILAALANGVALVAISIWVFIEAAQRFRDPPEPLGTAMLGVGAAGLAVNVGAALLVGRDREGSLNLEAAFRHVLADLAGSVGVLVAAVVIVVSGWLYADPLISVLIGVLVLASSWTVLRDSIDVLLETAPRGVDARAVGSAMAAEADVVDVHDLHIWTITSGFPALAAHVLCRPGADCHGVRRRLEQVLGDRFDIEHTTLQVDHAPGTESSVELGAVSRRRSPLRR